MKKILAIASVFTLALALGGTALAECRKGGGCDSCNQGGQPGQVNPGSAANAEPDLYRQFRRNTLDLRQDMMNKRFELQRENLKATADAAKVAVLKADIKAIQARINQIRLQSGIPDEGKRDGECFKMDGGCSKQDRLGGCNGQPCWQK
jgi:hypothetical protein